MSRRRLLQAIRLRRLLDMHHLPLDTRRLPRHTRHLRRRLQHHLHQTLLQAPSEARSWAGSLAG